MIIDYLKIGVEIVSERILEKEKKKVKILAGGPIDEI